MAEIATQLGVSKSSVSLWTRDIEFAPRPRRSGRYGARSRVPNALQRRKLAEIERLDAEGVARIGILDEQAFLAAGTALYAGEGTKRDGVVKFANSDPRMIALFCTWLRHFFNVDETRLRARLYLHEGLDLGAAVSFWAEVTRIPPSQFGKSYRAVPDVGIRHNKHEHGCISVSYSCARTHRAIMGLSRALLSSDAIPG